MTIFYLQVDNSFIAALPDDLKVEMKRDFHRQRNVLKTLTSPIKRFAFASSEDTEVSYPERKIHPVPFESPTKRQRDRKIVAGRGGGRKRGRPPKNSVNDKPSTSTNNKKNVNSKRPWLNARVSVVEDGEEDVVRQPPLHDCQPCVRDTDTLVAAPSKEVCICPSFAFNIMKVL